LIVHQVCDLVELRSGPAGTAIRLHMRLNPLSARVRVIRAGSGVSD
jgi:hypothetical protein